MNKITQLQDTSMKFLANPMYG